MEKGKEKTMDISALAGSVGAQMNQLQDSFANMSTDDPAEMFKEQMQNEMKMEALKNKMDLCSKIVSIPGEAGQKAIDQVK